MSLVLVTPPAHEPVRVYDVEFQAIVDGCQQTWYLQQLISAARTHVEQITWRQLITAEYEWRLDRLSGTLIVPRPPLQSVTSVQYVDGSGQLQTLDPAGYTVDPHSTPGRIAPAHGRPWPSVRGHLDDVVIRFKAGYGDTGDLVPEPLNHALLMLVAWWYDQREAAAGGAMSQVPLGFDALVAPYRVYDPRVTDWL